MKTTKIKCHICGSPTKKRDYKIKGNDGIERSVYLCLHGPHSTLIQEAS